MAKVEEDDVVWVKVQVPDDEDRGGQVVKNELADERRRKKAEMAIRGRRLLDGIGWHITGGLLMGVRVIMVMVVVIFSMSKTSML